MKLKILLSLILFYVYKAALGQEVHKDQKIEYSDKDKNEIIIKEFLILDKNTNEYLPLKIEKNNFNKLQLGIRYYNFCCLQTSKNEFWKGQIDKDTKGHAIFSDPIFGIRAFIKLTINYVSKGRNTLYKFFSVYAPSNDCLGSVKKIFRNGKWECPQGSNQPENYAQKVGKALNIGIHDLLNIRNKNGELNIHLLTLFISEVAKVETGRNCKFNEIDIKRAVELL